MFFMNYKLNFADFDMVQTQNNKLYTFWNEIAQMQKSFKENPDKVINNTKKLCEEQLGRKVLCLFDEASVLLDGKVNTSGKQFV